PIVNCAFVASSTGADDPPIPLMFTMNLRVSNPLLSAGTIDMPPARMLLSDPRSARKSNASLKLAGAASETLMENFDPRPQIDRARGKRGPRSGSRRTPTESSYQWLMTAVKWGRGGNPCG